ncbi:MAG: ATP-dependent DNA helicase RecG [Fimbriimonas sp.]
MIERSLATEVQFLKGVGPKNAKGLNKLGIFTVEDILFHVPRRYEDRRHLPPIAQVQPGQWVTVKGRLALVDARPTRGGMVILKAIVRDGTGSISLTWFNQPWIKRQLEGYKGEIIAYGQVKENQRQYEISSPEWEILAEDDDPDEFARIVPVYPSTEGLQQKVLRRGARAAVEGYLHLAVDPLPASLLRSESLPELKWALRQIHMPEGEKSRLEARRRLVFDEFLYLQLSLAMKRAETQQELGISFPIKLLKSGSAQVRRDMPEPRKALQAVQPLNPTDSHLFAEDAAYKRDQEPLWEQIGDMLPFDLTGAQKRVIEEIFSDMEAPHPMNRLVQGDVGSGKTAVAACAMLAAVRSGYQAALMAPTEILAEQHSVNLRRLFEPLGIEVELLVGKLSAKEKKKATERAQLGLAHVAVGTHALIQEGVRFANLGLVVVDEQHRFGVLQRKALRDKGLGNPDVLVMTATPIPRTLTMTVYGDLELSVIDELPPGRKPVKTHWKQPSERGSVLEAVRALVEQGRQAYFVCPMVSESEKMLAQAAEDLHYRLVNGEFSDLRIGLLHGQMKAREKEVVMEQFRRHELDVLVSTTVIEVGVDVSNASVMVIEDANRFGLSQLHQLRGRVGRGEFQSFCVLVAEARSEDARQRMEIMTATNDGFKIAEEDLRLRGPGELAGTKQHGNLDLKIADLVQDGRMLEVARQAAIKIIEADPELKRPEHALMLEKVILQRSDQAVITVS